MERDDDDDDNDENNRIDSITIRHSVVMMHECMAKRLFWAVSSLEKNSRINAYWADEETDRRKIFFLQTPVDCAFKPKKSTQFCGWNVARVGIIMRLRSSTPPYAGGFTPAGAPPNFCRSKCRAQRQVPLCGQSRFRASLLGTLLWSCILLP